MSHRKPITRSHDQEIAIPVPQILMQMVERTVKEDSTEDSDEDSGEDSEVETYVAELTWRLETATHTQERDGVAQKLSQEARCVDG